MQIMTIPTYLQNKVPLVGEKKYPLTDTQQACDLQFNHTQGITVTKYSRYRYVLKVGANKFKFLVT